MTELSPDNKKKVAVVYLSWLPYGIGIFQQFIQSYNLNSSGYNHRLIIVFNGVEVVDDVRCQEFKTYAINNLKQFDFLEMEQGQDIDAYFMAAESFEENLFLFLNSFSSFCSENWLKYYVDAYPEQGDALIGATASNQSLYSTVYQTTKWYWEKNKSGNYNFRKYKMFLKAFLYWRFFIKPFPNPHIRTNAFFLKKEFFLSLKKKELNRKFDAYLFESGKQSLTNQLLSQNCEAIVIDKHGRRYKMDEWMTSNTFWINNQENLLIADNQTTKYQNSDLKEREFYSYLAWGIKNKSDV